MPPIFDFNTIERIKEERENELEATFEDGNSSATVFFTTLHPFAKSFSNADVELA